MENQYTILDMAKDKFDVDKFNDVYTCYGFYDWFCNASSLKNKAKSLMAKVKKIVIANALNGNKFFDPQKTYIFFKNNCPAVGNLYDDFRICDAETGDVLFTIFFNHSKDGNGMWGFTHGFDGEIVKNVTVDEIADWFLMN